MHKVNPRVMCTNTVYLENLLKFSNIDHVMHGGLFLVTGFDDHNHLVNINSVFSTNPNFDLVDRTLTVHQPLKYHVNRPWQVPTQQRSLEQVMQSRVQQIESLQHPINIFWSGGIDSTAVVTAFLQYSQDLTQIRILYSPWSMYEHPEYLDFLKNWPQIECIDISGDVYMNKLFDGVFVSGDGGDEMNASLDQSFFQNNNPDILNTGWQDFFYKHTASDSFIDFCKQYFALSGRPINTVLEARWWFYQSCKMTSILYNLKLPYFVSSYNQFDYQKLIAFFDCSDYESFIYFNTEKILPDLNYSSWKQYLKDFCHQHNHLDSWYQNHRKITSRQIIDYTFKKIVLTNSQYLMILSDSTIVRTPNLPWFSARELKQHCQPQLDYIFNEPC